MLVIFDVLVLLDFVCCAQMAALIPLVLWFSWFSGSLVLLVRGSLVLVVLWFSSSIGSWFSGSLVLVDLWFPGSSF